MKLRLLHENQCVKRRTQHCYYQYYYRYYYRYYWLIVYMQGKLSLWSLALNPSTPAISSIGIRGMSFCQ